MRAEHVSQTAIAEYLGRNRSMIYRELARNRGEQAAPGDAILADAGAR
jgi:IS30 family transposase